MSDKLPVKIIADDPRFLPKRSTEGSAGLDLIANLPGGPVRLPHRGGLIIDCGFSMQLPGGWEAQIRPRSSLGSKGLIIPNAPGTIDSDYTGRIKVAVLNLGKELIVIEDGQKIAQMVIQPVYETFWVPVTEFEPTKRGDGGFGSTGN